MTDYDKTKEECWKELCGKTEADSRFGDTTKRAFDYIFESAYRYGRLVSMEQAKAQPVSNPDKFGNPEQLRATAAIAAMQGLLANPNPQMVDTPFDQMPQMAVIMADLLIKELNKTKEK